jgi:hypothetical protein
MVTKKKRVKFGECRIMNLMAVPGGFLLWHALSRNQEHDMTALYEQEH